MKALFAKMKKIAEGSPAPLFTSFLDDLYVHDFDIIHHDTQPGDTYYWAVKQCGTYLTLADKNSEYLQELMSPKHSPDRRHFLIEICPELADGFQIKEYSMAEIQQAVNKVRISPNRKPKRQFQYNLLTELVPELRGSILFSDFTCSKKAVLYLNVTNNSVSYFTGNKSRSLSIPFDIFRKVGAFKLTGTSDFGHAVMEPIKLGVYQRAQKKFFEKSHQSA